MNETDTSLDLDGLIVEPVHFRLLGQERVIKAIDVMTSFKFTKALERLAHHVENKTPSEEMLKDYFNIFSSCVEPFAMEDLLKMSIPQMVSLYGLIFRRMYGEDLAKTFEQKKKTLKSETKSQSQLSSSPRLSWLKRVFFSGGSQTSV